jgi:pyrimidine-nucleoside phosphorylase
MSVTPLFAQQVIAHKRDGRILSREEIQAFVDGTKKGGWADYQLSAMLMAIFIRGMDTGETAILTEAMMKSGVVADLSSVRLPKADKHSTGGVGDKLSLPLAPMVAACGVAVPMISGRGLGHTGGTLDKLEAIPGFRVGLSLDEYRAQMQRIGVALIGQTSELAPADKKLYSLRDVTATVECIPLICASILSKKLAEGIDSLVLDVKFGRGAFMKEKVQAQKLAGAMVATAKRMGKSVRALLTNMDQPLGRSVGNGLEVYESIECLKGRGPDDVMELTYALGIQMLLLAGRAENENEARSLLQQAVSSGAALAKFREIVVAQGGNPAVIDDPELLLSAPVKLDISAPHGGFIDDVEPMGIAFAALELGAGRHKAEDSIDHAVGVSNLVQSGEKVVKGARLATIHAKNKEEALVASSQVLAAIHISAKAPAPRKLIEELI